MRTDAPGSLAPREREVLQALTDGATYDTIAAALGITYATVGVHVFHASRKLGVRGRDATLARFTGPPPTCGSCGDPVIVPGLCGFCVEEFGMAA